MTTPNFVTLVLNEYDAAGNPVIRGTATLVPNTPLVDVTDQMDITPYVPPQSFRSGGPPRVKLLATDNANVAPAGWSWTLTFSGVPGNPPARSFYLPYTGGATQYLSDLTTTPSPPAAPTFFLPIAGGTLSGPLTVAATPSASPSGLPVGYGDSTAVTGLQLASSYPSDDVTNGTDGTGRLNLYSYQRANVYSFGETIRNFLMRWDAKAMTAWYGPSSLYDGSGNAIATDGWKPWAWAGAHYESNSHDGVHGHWEVEVPDSTGAMQGRLAVNFADTSTGVIGLDLTTIYTNLANFHFYCHGTDHTGTYQEQFFRLTAPAGYEKALEWNDDGTQAASEPRWRMAATATAESGANAGTNWALYRFSDGGSNIGTPISIARATGLVVMTDGGAQVSYLGVGTAPSGTVPLLVTGGSSNVVAARFLTSASGSGGNTQPIVQAEGQDVLNRAYAAALTTDSSMRWAVYTDGTTQWGTGAATRDVQLARPAAGVLTVTDLASAGNAYLQVGGSILVGATSGLGDGGAGVVAVANATTAPSSAPTGGGVLYGASGQPDWLDSGGKLWNLAQPPSLWLPSDIGILAQNYDPMLAILGAAPANNTITLIRVNVRAAMSCTNVLAYLSATGSGLVSNENFAGLYNSSGSLIGTTADQTSNWGSTGLKTMALAGGPYALTPGFYWVALLPNESAGTVPSFLRLGVGLSGTTANLGLTVQTARWATNTTGVSLPGSIVPGSNTFLSSLLWAALS